ncbi:MAG: hypothetical protein H8D43_03910 [Chloroflexi bacterium]|nr:hypothetical protein [Chloroflexota bacterium]
MSRRIGQVDPEELDRLIEGINEIVADREEAMAPRIRPPHRPAEAITLFLR